MNLRYGKTLIPVLFENDSCLVLDKPSGLSVQGGKGVGLSLDRILSEKISPRPLLVHRLDRDTSGVILTAKTKEAAAFFSALIAGGEGALNEKKGRLVVKRYLGVCSGIPDSESGVIRLDLEEPLKGQAKVIKKSETFFKRLPEELRLSCGSDKEFSFSLLELELATGRMHQIRRHLAGIAHPLLGDDKYGDFSLNKMLRKAVGLKNLLLHASRLIIPPMPGLLPDGLDVSAPLPDFFSRFIDGMSHAKPLTDPPLFQ